MKICLDGQTTSDASVVALGMEGSSISRIFGFAISARPVASICCSPPESVPATCRARSFRRGKLLNTVSIFCFTSSLSFREKAPMAYGQGPGQANNVGITYEALGFFGGQSFGLSLAAAGYLCACLVGVATLHYLARKGKMKNGKQMQRSGSVTVDTFQDQNEIPLSESVDRLSIQVALVLLAYLLTYLVTLGLTAGIAKAMPGAAKTLSPLLWGFNFIIGSMLALLIKWVLKMLRKSKMMTRQYQNNYLLSRISGLAFDLMIVAGITSIDFQDLSGLWVPFLLMATAGGVVTFFYLRWLCERVYPEYSDEGFLSMPEMACCNRNSGLLTVRPSSTVATAAAKNAITAVYRISSAT